MTNDLFLFVQREKHDRTQDCRLVDSFPFVARFEVERHGICLDVRVAFQNLRVFEDLCERLERRFDRGEASRELERIFELRVRRIVTKGFFGGIGVVQIEHIRDDLFADLSNACT